MKLTFLGQSGFFLRHTKFSILIDPYLSNSVQSFHGNFFKRITPAYPVHLLSRVDAIFVSHDHLDHCDPTSLQAVQSLNPYAEIFGTPNSVRALRRSNLRNLRPINKRSMRLGKDLAVHFLPAAHPKIQGSEHNGFSCIGFGIVHKDLRIYFSGDTSLHPKVIDFSRRFKPTHAILPVNERNYYRDKIGILGNLSIREAFGFCEEIGATTLIPCHWDMFAINSTSLRRYRLFIKHFALDLPFG